MVNPGPSSLAMAMADNDCSSGNALGNNLACFIAGKSPERDTCAWKSVRGTLSPPDANIGLVRGIHAC